MTSLLNNISCKLATVFNRIIFLWYSNSVCFNVVFYITLVVIIYKTKGSKLLQMIT